jgi:integrase
LDEPNQILIDWLEEYSLELFKTWLLLIEVIDLHGWAKAIEIGAPRERKPQPIGRRFAGRNIADLKTAFKGACRAAGIVDLHFHDLRHTFGTRAADAGVPLGAVAAVMGHADIHTTMRYAHATDEGRRRAVKAIEQTMKSRSQIGPRRQSELAPIAVST